MTIGPVQLVPLLSEKKSPICSFAGPNTGDPSSVAAYRRAPLANEKPPPVGFGPHARVDRLGGRRGARPICCYKACRRWFMKTLSHQKRSKNSSKPSATRLVPLAI